jgi:hydrogenase-4 transcriptional activator
MSPSRRGLRKAVPSIYSSLSQTTILLPAGWRLVQSFPSGPDGFGEEARSLASLLVEPVSVAVSNAARVELLREACAAAEADRASALRRLGRDALVDAIVGADGGLRPVMERVALVATSDVPVLIIGETGAGKEVIARAIHESSARSRGPFVRVNCGAIPRELVDSELFGHERGAFTGAVASRRGWFERADEGTLLLDEIGDLPPPAQVRLLRVLQEGRFERVGSERPRRVSVRVVAATHQDLPRMVQEGRFREDLWYRIAGFPILLPPLRERKQDIAPLAEHFCRRAARRFGVPYRAPGPADLALLTDYPWPGNIRELATVIDRAVLLADGDRLDVATALGGLAASPATPVSAPAPSPSPTGFMTLDDAVRRHIEAALAATRGRIEGPRGAGALLGVNPHTLRARMRRLGIDWAVYRP